MENIFLSGNDCNELQEFFLRFSFFSLFIAPAGKRAQRLSCPAGKIERRVKRYPKLKKVWTGSWVVKSLRWVFLIVNIYRTLRRGERTCVWSKLNGAGRKTGNSTLDPFNDSALRAREMITRNSTPDIRGRKNRNVRVLDFQHIYVIGCALVRRSRFFFPFSVSDK